MKANKKRAIIKTIVVTLIIANLFSFGIYTSIVLMDKIKFLVRDTTEYSVSELTLTKAGFLDDKIINEEADLKTLASGVAFASNNDEVKAIIRQALFSNGATTIWISDMEGNKWCSSDSVMPFPKALKDELFNPALEGKSGSSRVFVGLHGRDQLMFYCPIEKNGKQIGALYEAFPVSALQTTYGTTTFNEQGYSYVVDLNGNIVLKPVRFSFTQVYDNLQNLLKNSGNTEEYINKFLAGIRDGKTGSALFKLDNQDQFLFFTPLPSKPDWVFLTIIPLSVLEANGNRIILWTTILIIIIIVILTLSLIFAFALLFSGYRRQKAADKYFHDVVDGISKNTTVTNVLIDAHTGKVELVFENAAKILGINPEILYEYDALCNDPQYLAVSEIIFNERPTEKTEWEFETATSVSNEKSWLKITGRKILVGSREMFLFTLTDVTQDHVLRKQLMDSLTIAEDANRSKSLFLSNMSHDIRTPMNAIIGFSTLLAKDADNEEKVKAYTKKITSSSHHLLSLINDILDMSKIEAGKTTLNLSNENVANIISDLNDIVRPQMEAKKQTFEINVWGIAHEQIVVDRLRLNQILLNLLSNACKYTPENGKISMDVTEMHQRSRKNAHFRFRIQDNGYGMSPEFVKDIFKAFSREENSVTNKIQGTGLGLAITKNLIDLMGGNIQVDSEKGKGSTFTVNLEFLIYNSEDDESFWEKNKITNVLVVDDDEMICKNIALSMEGTGVLVDYALSGKEAIIKAERRHSVKPYNVILLDWKMPEMDGIETAAKLRETIPRGTPILILTSYDMTNNAAELREAGIDAYLPKPFFITNFRKTLDTIINGISAEEETEVEEQEEIETTLKGHHILVAEDNSINAEILTELLEEYGATSEICQDGNEVVKRFVESIPGKYDFILMDVQMPNKNGYEATKEIRSSNHKEAISIPIIAMTANAFIEDIKAALDSGMNAHVAKPIDMNTLITTLKKVVPSSRNNPKDSEENKLN